MQGLSFILLIEQSDIFLRLTYTDGDALTFREGLFLDKKVIASNVAKGSVGTYVFKIRDMKSLMQIIKIVSKNLRNNSRPFRNRKRHKVVECY